MPATSKPRKSRPATESNPFDKCANYRELVRASYLEHSEQLAEGAEALHTIELALVKACRALPAVYRMVIPAALGDIAVAFMEDRGAGEAEKLLGPMFSQLPLLLQKVREAGEFTNGLLDRQVNRPSDGSGLAAFVRKNTRLPQVLALGEKWDEEVFNATNR